MASSSEISPEQEFVRQIRRDIGVDEDLVRELARGNPGILNAVQNLKDKLARSLQILSDELYSKPAHFVLETIQNADDNSYIDGVVPELSIVLRESYMEVQCNEAGFSAANVKAFCGIGQSTKKNKTGYIGEKGIGAKAMFKVANRVHVHSLGYHFVLDRAAELGMISPQWTADRLNHPGWTLMRLDFCDGAQYAVVKSQLQHVRTNVLLFMRRLARLSIDDGQQFTVSRRIDGNICTIRTVNGDATSAQPFLRVAQVVPAHRGEPKRENVESTEIVLAFPLNARYEPVIARQMVHAFLPMRTVGFSFIIQADFLTAANREDVLTDLQWNKTIRDGICDTFSSAIIHFRSMPSLEMTWLQFLPADSDIVDPFFSRLGSGILAKLRLSEVIKCRDGHYRVPSCVKFPSVYALGGEPLIPEDKLSFHYVSNAYPSSMKAKLKLLGVQDMTFSDLMAGLGQLGHAITLRDNEWMEKVCSLLTAHGITYVMPSGRRRTWSAGYYHVTDHRIYDLPVAQLADGSWTNCTDTDALFFSADSSRFPSGLGINVLKTTSSSPNRRQLLERLGVKPVSPDVVVGKILQLHRSNSALTMARALEHVLYVYLVRHSLDHHTTPISPDSLWLADAGGQLIRGSRLYMDALGSRESLSSLLEPPARFLHSGFISPASVSEADRPEWHRWLQSQLGVLTVPRVVNGQPSPELLALITRVQTADTPRFLTLLRIFWPGFKKQLSGSQQHLSAFTTFIAQLNVSCRNGATVALRSTFLPNSRIAPFATADMPMLPIADPEGDWGFLGVFGVSSDVNAAFFLKRLLALSGTPDARRQDVEALYKQLEARYHEIAEQIGNAFQSRPLFLVDGRWLSRNEVVWDGPNIMTLKVALKSKYPALEGLFRQHLAIPDAQPVIIAQELNAFAHQHQAAPLSVEQKARLLELLSYAAQTIAWIRAGTCVDWTLLMQQVAMFPVSMKNAENESIVRLGNHNATFFLPDPSGQLEKLFARHVWFLAIPPDRLVELQPLIDKFGLQAKRIDRLVQATVCVDDLPVNADAAFGVYEAHETEAYHAKVPFLRRVQHFKGSNRVLLSSISLFRVERVKVTYALQGGNVQPISVTSACWSRSDAEGNLELFVASTASTRARRADVLREISQALGLGDDGNITVNAIIHFNDDEEINDMLINAGIREFEELERIPRDAVQDEPNEDDIEMFEDPTDEQKDESVSSPRGEEEPIDDDELDVGAAPARRSTASVADDVEDEEPEPDVARTPALDDDLLDLRGPRPPARRRRRSRRSTGPGHRPLTPSPEPPAQTVSPHPAAPVDNDMEAYIETDAGRREVQHVSSAAARARLPQVAIAGAPPVAGHENEDQLNEEPGSEEGGPQPRRRAAAGGAVREGLTGIAVGQRRARVNGNPERAPARARPSDDARAKQIGFLGENFVFELLQAQLVECAPAFTYKNWTSHFRSLAGHPPFEGQELADFVYHDKASMLTKHLFPPGSEYHGTAPEYYIEVKATSGDQDETFHMKRRQFLQAMQLSRAARKPEDPLQLYVLFRVSDIAGDGAPVVKAYVDPHDMLSCGSLRVESETIEMSITASTN